MNISNSSNKPQPTLICADQNISKQVSRQAKLIIIFLNKQNSKLYRIKVILIFQPRSANTKIILLVP